MSRDPITVELSDSQALAELAGEIHAWEPTLGLSLDCRQGLLFDSQGTLYALMLSERAELSTDRRRQVIGRGDWVVVPPGIGIEVDPEADFLLVCDDGPPPSQFRERFIQVWGFVHLTPETPRSPEVARHRVSCAWVSPRAGATESLPATDWDARLLVPLDGNLSLVISSEGSAVSLEPGTLVFQGVVSPPAGIAGPGRVAVISFPPEAIHRARLRTNAS